MSQHTNHDSLYELLPAIFRMRDAERGGPLRALLEAIAVQADGVATDIARLYDNWFIETCEPDVLPYFADLVGLQLGPAATSSASTLSVGSDAVWRRRQVANAIADRRRKGSFSVLEQLAADATGWSSRAIELNRIVMATQSIMLLDVGRRALVDTGDADSMEVIGTPLSTDAPLTDIRRLASHRTPGTAHPGSVIMWLWRLVAAQLRHAPAAPAGIGGRYAFDQLGRDTQLAVLPAPRNSGAPPATDVDVAIGITRRALRLRLEDYYGPARSICVYRGREPVPRSEILVANLGHSHTRTPPGYVSLDPELGRIAFPARHSPEDGVYVTYSTLGMGAIGGGSYERPIASEPGAYRVGARAPGTYRTVGAALKAWREASKKRPAPMATIEIIDDGVYEERFEIKLAAGERLEIRAAQGRRPILIPLETASNRPDRFRVTGQEIDPDDEPETSAACASAMSATPPPHPPVLVLDGLWIARHPLELNGRFGSVKLRHCTLVPASGLPYAGSGEQRRAPSLVVRATTCPISVVSSVLGCVRVESPEVGFDPVPLSLADTVIDASDRGGQAVHGVDERPAWAAVSLERVTVLGGAHVHSVVLVEDSIITGPLECERRQTGAVRYSYLAPGSRTPRRTSCQPDDALAAADEAAVDTGRPADERARIASRELMRLTPRFDGDDFGDPAYARLSADGAAELARGAHDECELGAYHNVWQALRVADLSTRLNEFAPAGTDIDIRFAT